MEEGPRKVALKLENWQRAKEDLIVILSEISNEIDSLSSSVCLSRIVGNTISSLGNVIFLAGMATVPITAGMSSILLLVGLVVGFTGVGISAGSCITESILRKQQIKKASRKIEIFNEETSLLLSKEASLYWNFKYVAIIMMSGRPALSAFIKFFQFMENVDEGANFLNLARIITGGKIFSRITIILNIIGIILDTIDTIRAVRLMKRIASKDNSKKPSSSLRELISKLETSTLEEIERQCLQFRGCIAVYNKSFTVSRFKIRYTVTDENNVIRYEEYLSKRLYYGRKKSLSIPLKAQNVQLIIESSRFCSWAIIYNEKLRLPCYKKFGVFGFCASPTVDIII